MSILWESVVQTLKEQNVNLLISKCLGYSMTLGACFYKLPIILNIFKAGNCEGLSTLSLYLETSAFLASLVYNINRRNPFSTFGDIAAIVVQLFFLIAMLWAMGVDKKNNKLSLSHMVGVSLLFAGFVYGITVLLPVEWSSHLMIYSIVVSLFSKLPQILKNFKEKDTGVQSVITASNAILGPVVKIYITLVETKDMFILFYSVLSFVLNIIILVQIISYGKVKND